MMTLAVGPYACAGTEASCVDLCQEAQAEDCTAIEGDCGNFCEAAFNVEDDSGCGDEREAYQSCLEDQEVCSNACGALENDWSTCLGTHCLTRMDDPDCQTLINSI
jgi:hypothetical protein